MVKIKNCKAITRAITLELERQKVEKPEYFYEFVIPSPNEDAIELSKYHFWELIKAVCNSLDILLLQDLIKVSYSYPELDISNKYLSLLESFLNSHALPDRQSLYKEHQIALPDKIKQSQMVGFLLSRCDRLYFHYQRYNRKFGEPDVWNYLGYAALNGNVLVVLRSIIHMARSGKRPYERELEEAWTVSCYFGFDDILKLLAGLYPEDISKLSLIYSYCRSERIMNLVLDLFPGSYPWWSVKDLLTAGGVEGLKVFFARHKGSKKGLPGKEVVSQDNNSYWWSLVKNTYSKVRGKYPNFLELSALHYDETIVSDLITTFLEAGVSPNTVGVHHTVSALLLREDKVALSGIRALALKATPSEPLEFDSCVDLNEHKAIVTQLMIEFPERLRTKRLNSMLITAFWITAEELEPLSALLKLGPVKELNYHVLHVLIFCYRLSRNCRDADELAVKMFEAAKRSHNAIKGESKRLGRYNVSHIDSIGDMYLDLVWKTLVPRLILSDKEKVVSRYSSDYEKFEETLSAIIAHSILTSTNNKGVRRPSIIMSLSERYHQVGFMLTAKRYNLSDEGEWEAIHETWTDEISGITFVPVVSMKGLKAESEVHGHCIGLFGTYRDMCRKYQLQVFKLLKGSQSLTTLGIKINNGQLSLFQNSGYKNRMPTNQEMQASERFIAKIKQSELPPAFVSARNYVYERAILSGGSLYERMIARMSADPLSSDDFQLFERLWNTLLSDLLSPYRLPNTLAIDSHGEQRESKQRLLTRGSLDAALDAAKIWINE